MGNMSDHVNLEDWRRVLEGVVQVVGKTERY